MPPPKSWLAVAAAASLAFAFTAPAADEGGDGGTRHGDVHTVSGKISAVAWGDRTLTIDAADGPVTLGVDRNTSVFLENRMGSLRDLSVGTPVRASFGGDRRAFWIELRPRGVIPSPARRGDGGLEAPDGGTADGGVPGAGGTDGGPAVLPPPGDAGPGDAGAPPAPAPASDAGAPPPGPGPNVPAGPAPPEPNPGAKPPPPPQPGPAGPGPVPGGAPGGTQR